MINGIRHNAAPLKHAKEYSSFKPVRATMRMQGHYVRCPMIYFNFYIKTLINPFAPGDFAEKRVLKLVEWFSGHCRAIKS